MTYDFYSHTNDQNRKLKACRSDNNIWIRVDDHPSTINIFLTKEDAARIGKELLEFVNDKKEE